MHTRSKIQFIYIHSIVHQVYPHLLDIWSGSHLISWPPQDSSVYSSGYIAQLHDWLQRAYLVVRCNYQSEFGQQKIQYDKNVHDKPLAMDDLVWLHFPMVTVGLSKKLHRLWTGLFKVLKKLSVQVHRIQSTAGNKTYLVVHVARLKPYQSPAPEESGDCPMGDSPIHCLICQWTSSFWRAVTCT